MIGTNADHAAEAKTVAGTRTGNRISLEKVLKVNKTRRTNGTKNKLLKANMNSLSPSANDQL